MKSDVFVGMENDRDVLELDGSSGYTTYEYTKSTQVFHLISLCRSFLMKKKMYTKQYTQIERPIINIQKVD